jgi:large subunit ribosomal protein L29
MKVDELRVLEVDELDGRLKAARRELYELRFKHAVGQLENSSQISKVRHDIARIMMVLRERDFGIVAQAAPDSIVVSSPGASPLPAGRGGPAEPGWGGAEGRVGTAEPRASAVAEADVAADEVKPKRSRGKAKAKAEEGS